MIKGIILSVQYRVLRILSFIRALYDSCVYGYFVVTKHGALDFVSMGLGIRARFMRNAKEWQPHLFHSQEFILKALTPVSIPGRMAVLGAGRLYDFPLREINSMGWQIDLYDYDPSLRGLWSRQKKSYQSIHNFYFEDITGVIEEWTTALSQLSVGTTEAVLADKIRSLPRLHPVHYTITPQYHTIISLNILSQLGLYWRDRVELIVNKLGVANNREGEFSDLIEAAVCECTHALEQGHYRSIVNARPELAIIISDSSYLYYYGDCSQWVESPALSTSLVIDKYHSLNEDSWFWHIAPRNSERGEYGEIHEVVAKSFTAKKSIY